MRAWRRGGLTGHQQADDAHGKGHHHGNGQLQRERRETVSESAHQRLQVSSARFPCNTVTLPRSNMQTSLFNETPLLRGSTTTARTPDWPCDQVREAGPCRKPSTERREAARACVQDTGPPALAPPPRRGLGDAPAGAVKRESQTERGTAATPAHLGSLHSAVLCCAGAVFCLFVLTN